MGLMFISDGSDCVPYLALHDAPHHVHRSHSPHECRRHCCQSPRVDSQERIDLPTREDLQIRQSRRTRQFIWFHATVLSVLSLLEADRDDVDLEMCAVFRARLWQFVRELDLIRRFFLQSALDDSAQRHWNIWVHLANVMKKLIGIRESQSS